MGHQVNQSIRDVWFNFTEGDRGRGPTIAWKLLLKLVTVKLEIKELYSSCQFASHGKVG